MPELIAGIEASVEQSLADEAYEGTRASDCLREAFGADVEITIPPPEFAVIDLNERRGVVT